MDIKPLICPQCGGEITNYSPGQTFATCSYCSTRFLISPEHEKAPDMPVPAFEEVDDSPTVDSNKLLTISIGIFVAILGISIIVGLVSKKETRSTITSASSPARTPTPASRNSTSPTPNYNLLEFGGKGPDDGHFDDASSIAVDARGQIYVSDDTLRVQQFDSEGNLIKTLHIPKKTTYYDHARTIDKIAVAADGRLYVAAAGVIQIYNGTADTPARTIQVAPDYIQDFALKSDGSLLMISDNDSVETLIFVNKAGKITKRIGGFHTYGLDAVISPQETAIEAVRLAVDPTGNIFSVYAFGDLASYQISSDNDDLMIARFTPEGKFVSKFVQSMNSCGIETDAVGHIYLSEGSLINVYSNTGERVKVVAGPGKIEAFALDKQNYLYVLSEDKVFKLPVAQ